MFWPSKLLEGKQRHMLGGLAPAVNEQNTTWGFKTARRCCYNLMFLHHPGTHKGETFYGICDRGTLHWHQGLGMRGRLPGGLHPSEERLRQARRGGDALHRP